MFFLFNFRLCDCHPRREQTSCSASWYSPYWVG